MPNLKVEDLFVLGSYIVTRTTSKKDNIEATPLQELAQASVVKKNWNETKCSKKVYRSWISTSSGLDLQFRLTLDKTGTNGERNLIKTKIPEFTSEVLQSYVDKSGAIFYFFEDLESTSHLLGTRKLFEDDKITRSEFVNITRRAFQEASDDLVGFLTTSERARRDFNNLLSLFDTIATSLE